MKINALITLLFFLFSGSLLTAQDFKFKKNLNKYVFKPKGGKLDQTKAFDHVEYKSSDTWYVKNNELWGILNDEGEFVLSVLFQQIDYCGDNSNLVKYEGKWGEYKGGQFSPSEGELIFNNPQETPYLSICAEDDSYSKLKTYEQCLLDVIYHNLRYPKEAVAQKIEGVMIAELIINEKGQVETSKIVKKIGGGCDEEFIRLIESNLSQWEPGKNDGEPVKSRKIIPIKMMLK